MKTQQIWHIYLIRTYRGSLYTGITTNVKRRVNEHQTQDIKCAKSLRGKGPLMLVFQKQVGTKSDALKLEHLIKKLPKVKKEHLVKTKKIPITLNE